MSSNQIIVLVCAIYFLTMVGTGIFAAKRNRKASDFLVAGRGLNVPMTAVTSGSRSDRRRHRAFRCYQRI